jgi:hypothetical protein
MFLIRINLNAMKNLLPIIFMLLDLILNEVQIFAGFNYRRRSKSSPKIFYYRRRSKWSPIIFSTSDAPYSVMITVHSRSDKTYMRRLIVSYYQRMSSPNIFCSLVLLYATIIDVANCLACDRSLRIP